MNKQTEIHILKKKKKKLQNNYEHKKIFLNTCKNGSWCEVSPLQACGYSLQHSITFTFLITLSHPKIANKQGCKREKNAQYMFWYCRNIQQCFIANLVLQLIWHNVLQTFVFTVHMAPLLSGPAFAVNTTKANVINIYVLSVKSVSCILPSWQSRLFLHY